MKLKEHKISMGVSNSYSVNLAVKELEKIKKMYEQKIKDDKERNRINIQLYKKRTEEIINYYKSQTLRMQKEAQEKNLRRNMDILRQIESLKPYENRINSNIQTLKQLNAGLHLNTGHLHKFNDIDGKCEDCNILGCKNGLINHRFSDIDGKCDFCNILGCKYNLSNHKFDDYDGKCDYCNILGCANGFIKHKFDDDDGKCDYCNILGCANGFIKHKFDDDDGKCEYCGKKYCY